MASVATAATDAWQRFREKQHEPAYMRNVLICLAAIMVVFTLPFMICSFVVASTANAGFNVVLTGLLMIIWECGSIWLMNKGPQAMSHGFLIGVSFVMFFLTFMTAIYWGQLAACDTSYNGDLSQYTCTNISAMQGVCAFAVLMWIMEWPFLVLIIQHRNTIIKETSYDDIGAGGTGGEFAYDQGPQSYGYNYNSNPGGGSPKTGAPRDL